jgi:hypothetical protein
MHFNNVNEKRFASRLPYPNLIIRIVIENLLNRVQIHNKLIISTAINERSIVNMQHLCNFTTDTDFSTSEMYSAKNSVKLKDRNGHTCILSTL